MFRLAPLRAPHTRDLVRERREVWPKQRAVAAVFRPSFGTVKMRARKAGIAEITRTVADTGEGGEL